MKIIMLGAPGAGKGTQAKKIAEKYSIPHISTGDIFRANIKNNTELGKKAKTYMDKGELVPDELVVDLIMDRFKEADCVNGYVLDGFPRTIPQAEALDAALSKINDNNALFKELTGKDMPYLRPPYGSYNDKIKASAGVPIVTWSLDTRDWESRNKDKVIEMVINNIKEGDIILFHDLYESTRDAVKELMPLLKEQGYQAVSVGELFKSKGITLEAGTSYRYAR